MHWPGLASIWTSQRRRKGCQIRKQLPLQLPLQKATLVVAAAATDSVEIGKFNGGTMIFVKREIHIVRGVGFALR